MASRLMHLSIASQLEKVLPIKDKNRFRIGSILPDAVISADKKEINSHFIEIFDGSAIFGGGERKHFDFYGFFDVFGDMIMSDELYLGYYFHLIEDNIFRHYLYYIKGVLSRRGDPELQRQLYRDYHILNEKLPEKYGFKNNLYVPQNFGEEKINDIYPFELERFLDDMQGDFTESLGENPKLITLRSLDKYFINSSVTLCSAEYYAVLQGRHHLARYDFSFENKHLTT